MNELSQHLEKLLSKYECVIIPGLGGFITYFEGAHWENNILIPPMRQIRFNQKLTYHDGLLSEEYMKYYGISYSEALDKIGSHVQEIQKTLQNNNTCLFGKIGLLVKDSNNNLILKSNSAVFLPENTGLSPITLHKIDRSVSAQPLYKNIEDDNNIVIRIPKNYTQVVKYAAMIILVFLINAFIPTQIDNNSHTASIIYNTYSKPKENVKISIPYKLPDYKLYYSYKANDIFSYTTRTCNDTKLNTEMPSDNDTTFIAKELSENNYINTKNNPEKIAAHQKGKYHLIVASLTSESQAEEYISTQTSYNKDQLSIIECNGKFRISARNFLSYKEALHHLDSLKNASDKSAWILCK